MQIFLFYYVDTDNSALRRVEVQITLWFHFFDIKSAPWISGQWWTLHYEVITIELHRSHSEEPELPKKDVISHTVINCIAFRQPFAVNGIIKKYIIARTFPTIPSA